MVPARRLTTFPYVTSPLARQVATGALISLLLAAMMAGLYAAPPIADAGPDRFDVAMHVAQTLDGTASSDPAGRPLLFAWKIVNRPRGSAAILVNPLSPTPSFTPDVNGTYEIALTVKAGRDAATDTVIVTTRNHPPTADGGVDVGARIGKRVRLVGLGSDPDADRLTYFWRVLSKPQSSRVSFDKPAQAATTLTLDRPGNYVVQFEVTDPFGLGATDSVAITHINSPPVTNAGPDEHVAVGTTVTLDASGSTDVDEDHLTYTWTLKTPKGSTASLSDRGEVQPTFTVDVPGSYLATLTAHDGTLPGNADSVVVTTTPLNGRPVADAGRDRRVSIGQLVQLDASRSSDPDGQALSYSWELQKKPNASAAALSSASDLRPEFLVDVPGTYVARLVVLDGAGAPSRPDTVTIATTNVVPIANAGPDTLAAVGTTVQVNGSGSTDVDGNELAYRLGADLLAADERCDVERCGGGQSGFRTGRPRHVRVPAHCERRKDQQRARHGRRDDGQRSSACVSRTGSDRAARLSGFTRRGWVERCEWRAAGVCLEFVGTPAREPCDAPGFLESDARFYGRCRGRLRPDPSCVRRNAVERSCSSRRHNAELGSRRESRPRSSHRSRCGHARRLRFNGSGWLRAHLLLVAARAACRQCRDAERIDGCDADLRRRSRGGLRSAIDRERWCAAQSARNRLDYSKRPPIRVHPGDRCGRLGSRG